MTPPSNLATRSPSGPVVVLGPQRLRPTLRDAVAGLGRFDPGTAHYAVVTAGWEEREKEHAELAAHLGGRTTNLDLRERAEDVFQRDPDLFGALLAHHDRLKQLQELYRVRLAHALDAARTLLARERAEDEPELVELARTAAIDDVRDLDARHFGSLQEMHAAFEAEWKPTERDAVAAHREELARILGDSSALCVAGGHVRILLNRLRLFDLVPLAGDRPIFCWSAGAMALAERIVVFHDSPPQGAGDAEVIDAGLGLLQGLVPLPHASRRLRLDDPVRVGLFARRFGPALCAALDEGARVDWNDGRWQASPGTLALQQDGSLAPLSGGSAGEVAQ